MPTRAKLPVLVFLRRRPFFYAAISYCLILFVCHWVGLKVPTAQNDISQFAEGRERTVFLEGDVVSDVEERRTFYGDNLVAFALRARTLKPDDTPSAQSITGKARVYLINPLTLPTYGDRIFLKGNLTLPKGVRNPGGFDNRAYLDRQGISVIFYGQKNAPCVILATHKGNALIGRALGIKHFLSRALSDGFEPDDAAFLKALFLGERSDLREDFIDLFMKTGTMHILAVSGFNVGFLILSVFFLLKPLPIPKNWKWMITLPLVWGYCLVVGWQAPVVRATLMATVFIASRWLGRKTDGLNTLGLAAFLILALSPKQISDVGFQLSFLAVLGMVILTPRFVERPSLLPNERLTGREKLVFYFKELFWVSFICLVVTMPVTMQNFYIVAPLSLIANLVVVPVSLLLFFTGILYFLTFSWWPKVMAVVPFGMGLLMKIFVGSLRFIEQLPGATIIVGRMSAVCWALLTGGIVYLLWDPRIRRKTVRAVLLALFIGQVFLAQDLVRHFHRQFKMTVLDVGEGDSIYFEFPEGGNLLIDAGRGLASDKGRWVVGPFLKSKGVRELDALVITHPQEDHIGGMRTVLNEFKVKRVIDAGKPFESQFFEGLKSQIARKNIVLLHAAQGAAITGFRGQTIRVLNPPEEKEHFKNINDAAIALKITYGATRFLLPSDVGDPAVRNILSEPDLEADVLKVPHHGARLSKAGERLVGVVAPKISVISVGEHNPFHHPSAETLKILSEVPGNQIFRTDEQGAIEILSNGRSVVAKPA